MPTALGTIASHRTAPATTGPPLTGLQLWLDADDASTFSFSSGVIVSQWRDKSGNNRHGTPSSVGPDRNGSINGRTAVAFHSNVGSRAVTIPSFASGFTSGEVFVAAELVDLGGSGTSEGGLHGKWGSAAANCHYPYSNGVIYEYWGSTTRPALGTPPNALTDPHIYNVRSAPNSYIAAMNGTAFYTSGTNTVGFSTSPHEIVQIAGSGSHANIGEYLVYDRILSSGERSQVESYLKTKWNTP